MTLYRMIINENYFPVEEYIRLKTETGVDLGFLIVCISNFLVNFLPC